MEPGIGTDFDQLISLVRANFEQVQVLRREVTPQRAILKLDCIYGKYTIRIAEIISDVGTEYRYYVFDGTYGLKVACRRIEAMLTRLKDALVSWLCRFLKLFFPRKVPSSLFPSAILVIKPCCLGDVLMSTPVITALRRAFPSARLDFAVGQWSRPMVENNPHLDGLLDCGPVGSGHFSWKDYWALVKRIRGGGYNACFVLDRSPVLSLLPFLAGVPHRIGLDSQGRGFSLTVGVPVTLKHEVRLYLNAVRAVGLEVTNPRLEFYPSEDDHHHVEGLLADLIDESRDTLVVIHPGGGHNPGMTLSAKRWPSPRFAALADRFIEESGAQVILIGGAAESDIAQAVRGAMRHPVLDLTGQLTWRQTGALLARCDLFVGHDTGAMHLAVAAGAPVVAIFGPSTPEMYGPYSPQSATLWHRVGCNPCFVRGRWNEACRHFKCIEAVTVEEVWQAAQSLVEKSGKIG